MDILERILTLRKAGERFVVATVVSRQPPVSSHIGDKAIVFEDGRLEGFIGGACSREIIRAQALESLRENKGRLVCITPDAEEALRAANAKKDEVWVPMSCASEGAVDVYLEPYPGKPHVLIVGGSPIAFATMKQVYLLNYNITLLCEADELHGVELPTGVTVMGLKAFPQWLAGLSHSQRQNIEAVIASMGHYDEEVLECLLTIPPRYIGLVGSRKRAASIREYLGLKGFSHMAIDQIRNPAGLDIMAKTPTEVAVSISAEMIVLRRTGQMQVVAEKKAEKYAPHEATDTDFLVSGEPVQKGSQTSAIDAVCGMRVDSARTRHKTEYDGVSYYFCCPTCKHKFLAQPKIYLTETTQN